jgi:uncharacterized protein YPO0396
MATLQNEIERAKQVTAKAKAETESARAELKLQRESLKRAEEFGQALDALEQALDRQIDDLSKAVVSGHHRVAEFNQVRGTCSPFCSGQRNNCHDLCVGKGTHPAPAAPWPSSSCRARSSRISAHFGQVGVSNFSARSTSRSSFVHNV